MPDKTESARILLAFDISPRSRAALEAAAALASVLDAELAGLFVEDVDLLHLSGLPFARELGLLTRDIRPMALHEMERALQREACEAQRQLAEAAGRLHLRWSFDVARGRVVSELLARASQFDLIVLGKRARQGWRLMGDTLAGPPARAAQRKPVVAVYDGSSAGERLLELSARLARANATDLQVLVSAATPEACAVAMAAAQSRLAQQGFAGALCRCVEAGETRALAQVARALHAGMLVLAGDGQFRSDAGLAALLNEIDCPVVLAG